MGLGKWIAGALGWAMFGPIGGILGYFVTSKFEQLSEAIGTQSQGRHSSGIRGRGTAS